MKNIRWCFVPEFVLGLAQIAVRDHEREKKLVRTIFDIARTSNVLWWLTPYMSFLTGVCLPDIWHGSWRVHLQRRAVSSSEDDDWKELDWPTAAADRRQNNPIFRQRCRRQDQFRRVPTSCGREGIRIRHHEDTYCRPFKDLVYIVGSFLKNIAYHFHTYLQVYVFYILHTFPKHACRQLWQTTKSLSIHSQYSKLTNKFVGVAWQFVSNWLSCLFFSNF